MVDVCYRASEHETTEGDVLAGADDVLVRREYLEGRRHQLVAVSHTGDTAAARGTQDALRQDHARGVRNPTEGQDVGDTSTLAEPEVVDELEAQPKQ